MTTSLYKKDKEKEKRINNNNNKNLSKSVAIKRPQTAKLKPYKSNFFQKIQELHQGYEIMKRKNCLDDLESIFTYQFNQNNDNLNDKSDSDN